MEPLDLSAVRRRNTLVVLEQLMMNKDISRVKLSRVTGLTKSTVGEIIREMSHLGIIREKRVVAGNIGRPAVNLGISPSWALVIGLSIERDRIEASLINSAKEILAKKSSSSGECYESFDQLFREVTILLDDLFSYAKERSYRINAIGIGIPGPLDTTKGIVGNVPHFSACSNVMLGPLIEEKYGTRVWLENDADMAALGEKYFGLGKDYKSFIYVFLDKGIGTGIVINHELYKGETNYAGELGQFFIPSGSTLTFLENEWGVDALLAKARSYGLDQVKDLSDLRRAEEQGDKTANLLTNKAALYIGGAILSLMYILGIPNVVIGGSYMKLGRRFVEKIERVVEKYLIHEHSVRICFSDIGDSAISLGSAANALIEYTLSKIKSARKNRSAF